MTVSLTDAGEEAVADADHVGVVNHHSSDCMRNVRAIAKNPPAPAPFV
jgi:hypothetical protein